MKYLVVILLLAAAALAQTYTTDFPLTENPISEGGKWINAGVVGLDWNNVATTPGFAFGTVPGTVAFADSWALLTGTWGPDQTAMATIKDQNPLTTCYQEHELVLRGNLSAHSATGYEITTRATNDGNSYLLIARWNGPLKNFTMLTMLSGSTYGVKTGDVFKATIVGNVITAYINGVQKAAITDNAFATGQPGMGFYLGIQPSCPGTNSDFGYTNYTAAAIGNNFMQANSGPSTIQSSNSSVSVSYLKPETAGDLNIVVVGWGDTSSSISAITDSQRNTYTRAVGPTSTTGLQQSIYYAKNVIGGSNQVSVTFNKAAAFPDVRILEYRGLSTTSPLDVTAAGVGTGTGANSGSATTTSSNELVFGAGTTGTVFSAAGSGFTRRMINTYGNIAEDKIGSSSGSYNATATTSSSNWIMQMATFRSSESSPPLHPAPTVSAISPGSGAASGGTAILVAGTGFLSGATVKLGGTAATAVTVVSSTSVTATTAAHAAGAVSVVVTNPDAQSGALSNGYSYFNPSPTVNAISLPSGTIAGGAGVTISGTGFLTGATVKLGGTTATNVTVVSSTTIAATTPAHTAGAVDVAVTNVDSQSGTLSGGYTYTSSASGAAKFVQVNYKTSNPSGSSLAVAYPLAQTAGNLNLVVVGWNDTTSVVSSVADSKGNAYTRAIGPTTGTSLTQSIYYAKNIASGSNTVTVTFNNAAAYPDVRVLEYSGLNPTNPLDATASAAGSGSLANSGSATITSASELIFGAGTTGGVITGPGAGFTSRVITQNGDIAQDKTVASPGSYNATAPVTPYAGSSTWVMQMATFKP
jgi:hypothetical protein